MSEPDYLQPYLRAAQRHGSEFSSLLWASPRTQRERFKILAKCCGFAGRKVIDAGCGRADLLDYLHEKKLEPREYVGIEAVNVLASAAEAKRYQNFEIVRGDFILDKKLLDREADLIVFSGSLNTLRTEDFYATIVAAWRATGRELAFNYLCSPELAAADHLVWHDRRDVLAFVKSLADEIEVEDDYLTGDCTVVMRK